ncbi:MAG: hypothetical protein EVG15_05775 [Candidatus Acididesulfobacter diazotrophicus]|uniref:PD-(D/E)XK endonuclease-like domain-containing protein n=1 Tax=Candidatus Acididesulfobacter diazotrophicus TaxID=2597226 RepID=A0A519BMP6_9DELT|nr:MAG: hypothetical protein EVG15_05775 [Candidatus Acididesulfobacter diazotrophicus]
MPYIPIAEARGFTATFSVKNNPKLKELIYKENDFIYAKNIVDEIFDIIIKGYYPTKKTSYSNRCVDCCYKNICV